MYLDTLTQIKNASERKHERVKVLYSRLDMAVLEKLAICGYIDSVARKGRGVKRIIDVRLKYHGEDMRSAITGMRFHSKPSRRLYIGYRDVKRSRQGHGAYILTTPKGVLTGSEARSQKVGGEILFEIW